MWELVHILMSSSFWTLTLKQVVAEHHEYPLVPLNSFLNGFKLKTGFLLAFWLGAEFHFHMNKDFKGNCYSISGDLVLCFFGSLKCFAKIILWILFGFSTFDTNSKKKNQTSSNKTLSFPHSLCLYKELPTDWFCVCYNMGVFPLLIYAIKLIYLPISGCNPMDSSDFISKSD